MDRDDILATLRSQRALLAEPFGVRAIALFGSQARGNATPSADIDRLVEWDPTHRTRRSDFLNCMTTANSRSGHRST